MRPFIALACIAHLSGCADPTAVRDISTRLTKATGSWTTVGGELAASCQRETMLNPALSECQAEARTTVGVMAANAVLADYFETLTGAASDSTFNVQAGLDAATRSVAAIPGIRSNRVDAVSGLVGLLAQLANGTLRERSLRVLIDRGAPNAKTVIDGLDEVLADPLASRLSSERIQLTSIYVKKIRDQNDKGAGAPADLCKGANAAGFSGTGFLLAQDYCRRAAIIDARKTALVDYRASLRAASAALTELQSSRAKLKGRGLAQRLAKIGSDLDEKITAVDRAFS